MFGDSDSDFEEDNQLNYELECINNYSCNLTKEQKCQLLNYRHKNNGLLAFHEGTEEALCLFVEKNCMNFNNDNDRCDSNYHKKKNEESFKNHRCVLLQQTLDAACR